MILGLELDDLPGLELLERIGADVPGRLPVVLFAERDLEEDEKKRLAKVQERVIITAVRGPERLLEATTRMLHRPEATLPEPKRRMLGRLHEPDPILSGQRVLIVDDDVRNIFALTTILERQAMEVSFAENGRQAIKLLEESPEVDVVLMDVMMPEMDGYETTQAIRNIDRFRQLPIITVTAKAMKEDRQKSLEAGASDYVTKPVDTEQLLSLLRVWLVR
jgi:CheY-like chemotaxis protein